MPAKVLRDAILIGLECGAPPEKGGKRPRRLATGRGELPRLIATGLIRVRRAI